MGASGVYHWRVLEAVVVANGRLRWTPELVRLAARADLLVAADGGADHLARVGLRPHVLVGDLDSVSEAARAWVGEERVLARPDQDRTDLDKALVHALDERGADRLTVLGALGGRVDHELGNLGLLARRALGERLVFREAEGLLLATARPLELPAAAGETWSFLTFDPAVRVTLEGVRWPVRRRPLDLGSLPSISNLAAADRVRVAPEGGAVVAIRWFAARLSGARSPA